MKDLKMRSFIACAAFAILFLLFFLAEKIVGHFLLVVFLSSLCLVGLWEYKKIVQKKGICLDYYPLAFFAFVFLVFSYFSSLSFISPCLLIAIGLCYLLAIFYQKRKELENAIVYFALSCFAFSYIVIPTGLIFFLLYHPYTNRRWWFLYLVLVTKSTDMGAYLGGRILGKRLLCPKISPKKTKEGAVCGTVAAVFCSLIFVYLARTFPVQHFILFYPQAIFLGLLLALLSQLGDLFASVLKRDAKMKDSNNIPGIGGILDVLDSLLFTTPALFCILYGLL